MKPSLSLLLLWVFIVPAAHARSIEIRAKQLIDSLYRSHPNAVGIILHIESPDNHLSWSYAAGYADKGKQHRLDAGQPVLLASNTKTYVSAAILKLVAQKAIGLDEAIDTLISDRSGRLLKRDGYSLQAIKIRHLLSHTSGIDDYVNDDYFEFVNTHPKYLWTRDEQIALGVKVGRPLGQPGDTFKYADINYLLLTEIIEHCTHMPFYLAIRELIDYRRQGLNATWFTSLEQPTRQLPPLAHQYWDKYPWDSYELNPSWDLYGGGGLVATAKDLACFFQKLFEGKIVRDRKVLAEMYTEVPCKSKTNYCLGIRKLTLAGMVAYYHGGFWGTDAIYFPALHTTLSIVILERSEKDISADICKAVAAILKEQLHPKPN